MRSTPIGPAVLAGALLVAGCGAGHQRSGAQPVLNPTGTVAGAAAV